MNIKDLLKHILLIILFLAIVLACVMLWLRIYTNHGQQLVLPDYEGQTFEEASKDAKSKTFRMTISDSVHIVGRKGGEIVSQNPKANSKVKENRKIYVTTTKYDADLIQVATLPTLYGTEYSSKCKDLAYLELDCKIKGYKYDAGEKDHILEVYHNGTLIASNIGRKNEVKIEKGSTLEFILSKRSGAQIEVHDYTCRTYAAAKFATTEGGLTVGSINASGEITNTESAYVISQNPAAGSIVESGTLVNFVIQQAKPADCN